MDVFPEIATAKTANNVEAVGSKGNPHNAHTLRGTGRREGALSQISLARFRFRRFV